MRNHLDSSHFETKVAYTRWPGKHCRHIINFIKISSFREYLNMKGDKQKEPCCVELDLEMLVLIYDSIKVFVC